LLANATTTLLLCALASIPRNQSPNGVDVLANDGNAARAPWIISLRKYSFGK
jgi:hypothetical protein